MSDLLTALIELIVDKEKGIPTRILSAILIIFLLVTVEISTGFFSFFFVGQRIDQLEKIETILAMPTVNDSTKVYLKNIEHDILSYRSFRDIIRDFVTEIKSNLSLSSLIGSRQNMSSYYLGLHIWSSAYPFFGLTFFLPLYFLKNPFSWNHLVAMFIIALFLIVLGLFVSYCLSFIPIFEDHTYINFFINVIVSLGVLNLLRMTAVYIVARFDSTGS